MKTDSEIRMDELEFMIEDEFGDFPEVLTEESILVSEKMSVGKIICPVDFSPASLNAVNYAAALAQKLSASFLLINVQRILVPAASVSLGEGIGATVRENSALVEKKLCELCQETAEAFNISADYDVEVTTKSLQRILSSRENENAMIVMGTDGIDDLFQFFFGTNTYNTIKKANCPVLVIPDDVIFHGINNLAYAWDNNSLNHQSMQLINEIRHAFRSKITFLHINKPMSEPNRELINKLRSETETVFGGKDKVSFEQFHASNVPEALATYMYQSKSDLLAITYYHRGQIADIFHGKVARELSETASFPVLVMHG